MERRKKAIAASEAGLGKGWPAPSKWARQAGSALIRPVLMPMCLVWAPSLGGTMMVNWGASPFSLFSKK